ncbi:UNKNOWN [Stylonychia lemnae]|uniref:B box-type domain-containing protein n=1 Tax=Stylonychia lemnae TaxID=5949 RepID=A0A077ZX32_STYLE|nr:UNKNOWN [Stylonychia lemnae]|eukprot:CDW74450.1 UNKNOWN [Stylonychia lemnae]
MFEDYNQCIEVASKLKNIQIIEDQIENPNDELAQINIEEAIQQQRIEKMMEIQNIPSENNNVDQINQLSTSVILLNQNKQSPIESLMEFSKHYNAQKASKKELCHDHNLRKTSFCIDCKLYICDRCLPMSSHANHNTKHLSLMAHQVLETVRREQTAFEENLSQLQEVNPSLWQSRIRTQLIQLFESFQEKINLLKQQAFKQLNAVIKSMNFPSFVQDIEQLQQSREILKKQFDTLQNAFNNNFFSQIAQRQKHYRSYIESLEILNIQSLNLRQLVEHKSMYIQSISKDLKSLKAKLQDAIKQMSKDDLSNDQELLRVQQQDVPQTQCVSPFLVYIREREKIVKKQYPTFSYLEVVAYLQNQWQKEENQMRYLYEKKAEKISEEQNMRYIPPSLNSQKGQNDATEKQQSIVNINGVKRVFNIIYCSKLSSLQDNPLNHSQVIEGEGVQTTMQTDLRRENIKRKLKQNQKYEQILNKELKQQHLKQQQKYLQQLQQNQQPTRMLEDRKEKKKRLDSQRNNHIRDMDKVLKYCKVFKPKPYIHL